MRYSLLDRIMEVEKKVFGNEKYVDMHAIQEWKRNGVLLQDGK